MGGILLYLANAHSYGSDKAQLGLYIVYGGFVCFFISYGLRAYYRFGIKRKRVEESDKPAGSDG